MREVALKVTVLFSLLLVLGACASSYSPQGSSISSEVALKAEETSQDSFNQELFVAAAKIKGVEYRLGPGDVVQVSVFGVEELKDMTGELDATGVAFLPLIGGIKIGGLTLSQAKESLTKAYSKYVVNPKITVGVQEYRSYSVSVLGDVTKPGVYNLRGGRTILDVIAMAGGLGKDASKSITVVRLGEKERKSFVVDLGRLVALKSPNVNFLLEPGDMIYVPRAGSIFVDGGVKKPGSFPLTSPITVTQALAMAGGMGDDANTSKAHIYRLTGKNEREHIEVDLRGIREGKAKDPFLQENDVVFVTTSGFKKFVGGFLRLFGLGFSSSTGASSYRVGVGE